MHSEVDEDGSGITDTTVVPASYLRPDRVPQTAERRRHQIRRLSMQLALTRESGRRLLGWRSPPLRHCPRSPCGRPRGGLTRSRALTAHLPGAPGHPCLNTARVCYRRIACAAEQGASSRPLWSTIQTGMTGQGMHTKQWMGISQLVLLRSLEAVEWSYRRKCCVP